MSYDPNQPPPYQSDQPASPQSGQPSYPPPPANYGNQGAPGGYPNAPVAAQGNGLAIAGFVVSLVSIIFTGILGLILAVVAAIMSFIGLQRAKAGARYRGLALAGLIISGIIIVLSVILIVIGVGIVLSNN